MITVHIDEIETRTLIKERIAELIKDANAELVFWDSNELKRMTCMSMETIQNTFFYDVRFSKHKIGGKWYYPAKEARSFLETWLSEQK